MIIRFSIVFFTMTLAAGICRAISLPVIDSLSPDGLLVCTNLQPGSVVFVESSLAFMGLWATNWSAINQSVAGPKGTVQATLPLTNHPFAFFRVVELPPPTFTPDGMALVPAGSFIMGDSVDDGLPDAIPINIYVSAFNMDTNLITYSKWQSVYTYALANGYSFDNAGSAKSNVTNQPIQTINWYDALKWCNARSQNAGLTPVYYTDSAFTQIYTSGDADTVYPNWAASGYHLPTEAQWEKAARGGLGGQRFPWGDTISESQANYQGNTESVSYDLGPDGFNTNFDTGGEPYTSPVGYFPANGYGLNDMAGNLLEWCWDWYGTPYGQPTTNNPTGPSSGEFRVERGGYWGIPASFARSALRIQGNPASAGNNTGFRCVRNP